MSVLTSKASEHIVRAALVRRLAVMERPADGQLVGYLGGLFEQFTNSGVASDRCSCATFAGSDESLGRRCAVARGIRSRAGDARTQGPECLTLCRLAIIVKMSREVIPVAAGDL